MVRRSLAGVALVGVATALAFALVVALTLGTRWGFETYLFPYLVGASLLPLAAALVTRRREFVGPSLLLAGGVVAFVAGVTWNLACLQGNAGAWGSTYSFGENVLRWGPTVDGSPACSAKPNRPAAILGYVLTTVGALRLLDVSTSRDWWPLGLRSGLDAD